MSALTSTSRRTATRVAAGSMAAIAVLSLATAVLADAPPAPGPSAPPDGSPLAPSPSPTPGATLFPLPAEVMVLPSGTTMVSLMPTSSPGVALGRPVPFSLGHCGLHSPVDIDGSLWKPVAGHDATGAPIEGDAEVGELINATEGLLTLVDAERAEFRTRAGLVVAFERAPGALAYPLCM